MSNMKKAILALVVCGFGIAWAEPPVAIEMKCITGLKYDLKTIYVKPGASVELSVFNDDIMLHNLVIVSPGKRLAVVQAATTMIDGSSKNYVPDSPDILHSMPVIPQKETRILKFKAPEEEGDYPYVCTYPGHGFIMFGTMVVTRNPKPHEKTPAASVVGHQHGEMPMLKVPTVRRLFLPDTGPASIAIALPGKRSYCWDSGACRFRYAWSGGFIKNLGELPSQLPKAPAQLDGEVFYREKEFPLQIGDHSHPTWEFFGYQIDQEGYPEFFYKVNSAEVSERIEISESSIMRHFVISGDQAVKFRFDPALATGMNSSGRKRDDHFEFTPDQARSFTITITRP